MNDADLLDLWPRESGHGKFCEACAVPIKRTCASCGCELRPTAPLTAGEVGPAAKAIAELGRFIGDTTSP